MGERSSVLVTGGAGFIGSHLVDRLLAARNRVRVLDSLEQQVHGSTSGHRNAEAEYFEGSILDRELLAETLVGVQRVVHLAAQVGIGLDVRGLPLRPRQLPGDRDPARALVRAPRLDRRTRRRVDDVDLRGRRLPL